MDISIKPKCLQFHIAETLNSVPSAGDDKSPVLFAFKKQRFVGHSNHIIISV